MLKNKSAYLKLFIATLLTITALHSTNNYFASQVSAQEIIKESFNHQLIAKKTRSRSSSSTSTRKSGGRSGGGSFKSKSKSRPSNSRSTTRKSNKRSSSRDRNYNRSDDNYDSRPTYNNRSDNTSSYSRTPSVRSYTNTSTPISRTAAIIIVALTLIAIGGIIFIPLFIILKLLFGYFNRDNRQARQVQQEIDNNRVTISKIQVALLSDAIGVQQDLSELTLMANTETPEGLLKLMQDTSLIVVRNSDAWTHVLSSSVSMDISKAESAFESLSLIERSKYSQETLSNIDGDIRKLKEQFNTNQDDFAQYIVVTLIFGTVDDRPLFEKINNKEQLEAMLLKLAAMREDYLIKFELLWSPQTEGVYLTDEELLMQYTELMPLV